MTSSRIASISEDRRNIVLALGAAPLLAMLPGCPWKATTIATKPRIDAHCHVFNILDMPAFSFLLDVLVQSPVLRPIAAPFAWLLVEIVRAPAHTNAEEKIILQAHLANPSLFPLPAPMTPAVAQALVMQGFVKYIAKYTSIGKTPLPTPSTIDFDKLITDWLLPQFLPTFKFNPLNTPAQNLQLLIDALPDLAKKIADAQKSGAVSPEVSIGAYLAQFLGYWAPKLAEYRFILTNNVAELYNGATPVFMTPATLDIGYWLEHSVSDDPWTSLSDQAELMKLISLVQSDDRAMHGLIAFDPWRHVDDKQRNIHPNALEIVRKAIEEKGFIGVKLYPPMGFRAIGNAGRPDSDFVKLPRHYANTGLLLDTALLELYDYCNANEVPIMAHCAPSQGPSPAAAQQAHPMWWAQLLDIPKYKSTLRVNLGHFGGVWDFDGTVTVPSKTWTKEVAEMIQNGGYGYLYTDFGDFSNILDRDSTDRLQLIIDHLTPLIATNTAVRDRILYGSDWLMLGIEPGCDKYFDKMKVKIGAALGVTDLEPLLGGNAVRFLGLASGTKTRMRLEKFYTDNGKDKKKLEKFAA